MGTCWRDEAVSEIVTLVDPDGAVAGPAARSVVRAENLLHEATAVLVRNSARQIYVQRRSSLKDWAPSHHDAGAGGLVRWGEDPATSAVRELAEELGISVTVSALRPLGRHRYEDATTRCVQHCYEVTWDGPVSHADGEVVWGAWMQLAELSRHLADPAWPFVPDGRALLAQLSGAGDADYRELGSAGRPAGRPPVES